LSLVGRAENIPARTTHGYTPKKKKKNIPDNSNYHPATAMTNAFSDLVGLFISTIISVEAE
jgi:hypothetical protein